VARLLVAEDHEEVRVALVLVLQGLGHEVTAVANGQEALDVDPAKYDAILMDLDMPVMGGRALKVQLDLRSIQVPLIIVSGERDSEGIARELGAARCVPKPINVPELTAALAAVLRAEQSR
jgi:CheY-like chemotaxis protein